MFIIGHTAFLIYFSLLFYIAIVNKTITDGTGEMEKYKRSSLNSGISQNLIERIENYMLQNKPYIDPELCLRNLSLALNTQEKYISEVINKLKDQNFSEFVNSYRISYAMDLLKKPENKERTMLYILFESGFNSKTSFNTHFKKMVGCTPFEYRKKFST